MPGTAPVPAKPVLLTRPLEDSQALAETLEAEGIPALVWPLTRIVPTETELKLPHTTGGLLFTSVNGVRALAALVARRDLPALCVGEATARAARRAGFLNCFSADSDARALADLARRSGIGDFFHPRGREAAGDLKSWLAETGQRVSEAVLYKAEETGPPPAPVAAALRRGEIGLITIWSARNARILVHQLAEIGADLRNTALLGISPAAAEPLTDSGFCRIIVAKTPNSAAMLTLIRAHYTGPGQ